MVWFISKYFLFLSCCWKQEGDFSSSMFGNLGKLRRWFLQYCESPLTFSSSWCLNLRLVHTEASACAIQIFLPPEIVPMEIFVHVSLLQQIMTPCICLSDFIVIGIVICLVSCPHLWIQEGLSFQSLQLLFVLGTGWRLSVSHMWNQKSEVYFSILCYVYGDEH